MLPLDPHVAFVGLVGGNREADPPGYLDAQAADAGHFVRVVGDQLHAGDAQVFHDLHGQVVLALVGLEAEGDVGLDGVHAVVLERVGLNLVVQADAPAFLPEVDQSP